MKLRHISTAIFLLITTLSVAPIQGQVLNALRVSAMPLFPDLPQDTAYEGQTYTFELEVINNSNIFINNSVSFDMEVDSGTVTFLTNPQTTLPPGDTIYLTVTPFNFQPPLFKAGNNIVVVWPVVNGIAVPVDSFVTNVFFIPLNSVGGGELTDNLFNLHPNPVNDQLQLYVRDPELVEYVRIYAFTGQMVSNIAFQKSGFINVSHLSRGIYILEVNLNGKMIRRKFLKQ